MKHIAIILAFLMTFGTGVGASPWLDFLGSSFDQFNVDLDTNGYDCSEPLYGRHSTNLIDYHSGSFNRDFEYPVRYDDKNRVLVDIETGKILAPKGQPFKSKRVKYIKCDKNVYAYFLDNSLFKIAIKIHANCWEVGNNCFRNFGSQKNSNLLKRKEYGFMPQPSNLNLLEHEESFVQKFSAIWEQMHVKHHRFLKEVCNELLFSSSQFPELPIKDDKVHCLLNASLVDDQWSSTTFFETYNISPINSVLNFFNKQNPKYNPKEKFLQRRDFVNLKIQDEAFKILKKEIITHFSAIQSKKSNISTPQKSLSITD